MTTFQQFRSQARLLRENSGTSNIEATLHKAAKVLALFEIPHFVCGGLAVQEHGFPRFTNDADIIVPDVPLAHEKLCMNGFKANPGSKMTVTDRETRVEIDLLPGGGKVGPGPLTLPMPTEVSNQPVFLTLEKLIAAKLSSYMGSRGSRARDLGDVAEVIKANRTPRNLPLPAEVADEYRTLWDQIKADGALGECV